MSKVATPVRAALKPESKLLTQVKDGLGALDGSHKAYFDGSIRASFADSLNLDEAVRHGHDTENRWDYLLGHAPTRLVLAVEPHTANTHEIKNLIKKRAAALNQLREHLRDGARVTKWLWVASGKVDFAATEKARLRLDQAGIEFVGTRVMAKHLPTTTTTASGSGTANAGTGPSKKKTAKARKK